MSNSPRYTERQQMLLDAVEASAVDGVRGILPGYVLSLDDSASHFYRAAQSLARRGRLARREIAGKVYWMSTP